jgi:zinc transport system substrate-binding protein
MEPFEKIPVAVTILPQAYIAERIGGTRVLVNVMIPKGMNPETYEPTPQQLINLSKAKVYVKIGRDNFPAEQKFTKIIKDNGAVLDVVGMATDSNSRDQDPHIWVSPSAVKKLAQNLCGVLAHIDPPHRAYFEGNLSSFLKDTEKMDQEIRAALAGKKGMSFIVYHPAWSYFAAEYGLKQLAIEEEGKPVNMSHMRNMIDLAKKKGIDVVYVQKGFDLRGARAVAAEIKGRIVETDPLEKNWHDNMKNFANILKESLR